MRVNECRQSIIDFCKANNYLVGSTVTQRNKIYDLGCRLARYYSNHEDITDTVDMLTYMIYICSDNITDANSISRSVFNWLDEASKLV